MASLIKLDYDMDYHQAMNLFWERGKLVNDIIGLHGISPAPSISESKSGNIHVTIEVKEDLEPLEVLAVQLIMGSDPVREAFNLRRIRRGQKNWNILFKPKRRLL